MCVSVMCVCVTACICTVCMCEVCHQLLGHFCSYYSVYILKMQSAWKKELSCLASIQIHSLLVVSGAPELIWDFTGGVVRIGDTDRVNDIQAMV